MIPTQNTDSSNLEPPEKELTVPCSFDKDFSWLVVSTNSKVNREWQALIRKCPENAKRCYEHMATKPTTRVQGRIFPLKGKHFQGAWEYEITKGDRVFYILDEQQKKVIVYYAGEHPKGTPKPP
jgi:Txe/YoeB family toxin of Txe-Axe toxin-antitoxin module